MIVPDVVFYHVCLYLYLVADGTALWLAAWLLPCSCDTISLRTDTFQITCDLMDFASVRTAADEVLAATADTGVDVLLCNAGVMALSDKVRCATRPVLKECPLLSLWFGCSPAPGLAQTQQDVDRALNPPLAWLMNWSRL